MGLLIGVIALVVAWAVVGLLVFVLYEFRWKRHAASDTAHGDDQVGSESR